MTHSKTPAPAIIFSALVKHFAQQTLLLFSLLSMLVMQGCTSFVPAQSDTPLAQQVHAGDRVRMTMNDGSKHNFVVTKADNEGFYNDENHLLYTNVKQLQIEKNDSTNTGLGLVALGIIGLVVIVLGTVNAIEDTVDDAL